MKRRNLIEKKDLQGNTKEEGGDLRVPMGKKGGGSRPGSTRNAQTSTSAGMGG